MLGHDIQKFVLYTQFVSVNACFYSILFVAIRNVFWSQHFLLGWLTIVLKSYNCCSLTMLVWSVNNIGKWRLFFFSLLLLLDCKFGAAFFLIAVSAKAIFVPIFPLQQKQQVQINSFSFEHIPVNKCIFSTQSLVKRLSSALSSFFFFLLRKKRINKKKKKLKSLRQNMTKNIYFLRPNLKCIHS